MERAPTTVHGAKALIAGRYQLGELLGRGGMGEVRAGQDLRLGRPVAVKLLRLEMASQPIIRQRFEAEAHAAARLVHPNVVMVFDTGEDDGVPFIVMERLSGQTLADLIARGPLAAEATRQLGWQVLGALGAAHQAGIIHRDIKPSNILAGDSGDSGDWRVGDFGIAKSLEAAGVDLTSTGLLMGTPAYLAPERLAGGPATVASDLYAVGVVLYEALAARKPFQAESPLALAAMVGSTDPEPIGQLRPDIDRPLAAVVERAMARDPRQRFPSAEEMASALRAERKRRPAAGGATSSRPASTRAAAATASADATLVAPAPDPTVVLAPPAPSLEPALPAPRRSARTLGHPARWGIGAVALLVVILSLVLLGHHHAASPTTSAGSGSPATPAATAPVSSTVTGPTDGLPASLDNTLRNLERLVQP